MAKYILGIDEGTTGARAFVIDDRCEVLGLAAAELTQNYPRPGWIEHDPMEILSVQLEVIRKALRQAGIYVRYFNKPRIDPYLRITIGTDEEMEALTAFLKKYLEERGGTPHGNV